METEKIGFFKRVKMAIFNLEKYSIFANERFSKALKYLILLTVIVTVFLAISSTVNVGNEVGKFINYVKSDEFPDFELADGKLSSASKLDAYDKEYNSRLIIDTTEDISDEKINEYKDKVKDSECSVILLKDKIIYRFDPSLEENFETTYNNVTSMFGIKDITKDKIVNDYLNDDMLVKLKVILFVYAFITILLLNVLTLLEDVIIIGVFGWIATKISRVPLAFSKTMSLAIYSLTLSIILSTIYSIVYSFTGFNIKYFEVMYMIIAYIYIVAAIMIMKEGNKTAGEAVTVDGEVLKTDEENEEDKDEYEEKENKKKKLPEKKDKEKEEIPEDNSNDDKNQKEKNDKGEE